MILNGCGYLSAPGAVDVVISDGMIGGIVGTLLFVFVAIVLVVLAVKIFNKRRQREKSMRYGNGNLTSCI